MAGSSRHAACNDASAIPVDQHDRQIGSRFRHEEIPGVQIRVPATGVVTGADRAADLLHDQTDLARPGAVKRLRGRHGSGDTAGCDTGLIARSGAGFSVHRRHRFRDRSTRDAQAFGHVQLSDRAGTDEIALADYVPDPATSPVRTDDDVPERMHGENPRRTTAPLERLCAADIGRCASYEPGALECLAKIGPDHGKCVRRREELESIRNQVRSRWTHGAKMAIRALFGDDRILERRRTRSLPVTLNAP